MRSGSGAESSKRNLAARIGHWLATLGRFWGSPPLRQLHLRETLTLGEKRFIAVVEFDAQKFLIAGTGSSVAMLTALPSASGAQPKSGSGAGPEEIPTWAFCAQESAPPGSAQQLIRG